MAKIIPFPRLTETDPAEERHEDDESAATSKELQTVIEEIQNYLADVRADLLILQKNIVSFDGD